MNQLLLPIMKDGRGLQRSELVCINGHTYLSIMFRWKMGGFLKNIRGLTSIGRTLEADITCRAVRQPVGPGYYLVGDVTAVLDPASSHGILKAIMSGMMVGHLIAKVKMVGCKEHLGIEEYYKWIRSWS
ncbi:hypothetical protein GXB80_25855 [Paenibacillus polymyxa]|nr:hypothetical protein [Paenibacillus polymyxa]